MSAASTAVTASPSLGRSSLTMAIGTFVSRITGMGRAILLVAALGRGIHADIFTIANTIPNALFTLLAGGVFTAVLVPQMVRALGQGEQEGQAYINRILTLGLLFLAAVTVILVFLAPVIISLVIDSKYQTPQMQPQRESMVALARYCLPQVFFYGMFVLVSQVQNARGVFGPTMWAPIVNNVIAMSILGGYIALYGTQHHQPAYTTQQELLLGVGSTLGIVAQALLLLPYLRGLGLRFRPRFDFLHTGLGHTAKLSAWTLLSVVGLQLAFFAVTKLASAGTSGGDASGTGNTVYASAYTLILLPHGVATVSLATAILPRLSAFAHHGDMQQFRDSLASTLRLCLLVIVPFVALTPLIAYQTCSLIYGWGATNGSVGPFAQTFVLFAPGLAFFTAHFMLLRGFYALEMNRQACVSQFVAAGGNIALAWVLTRSISPAQTAPRLALAYTVAYLIAAVWTFLWLRAHTGGLQTRQLVAFGIRLVLCCVVAVAAALAAGWAVDAWLGTPGWLPPYTDSDAFTSRALLARLAVPILSLSAICLAFLGTFLASARLIGLHEIDPLLRLLRLRRGAAVAG